MFERLIELVTTSVKLRLVATMIVALSMSLRADFSRGQVRLVRDINTQIGNGFSADYSNFVSVGGYFYFVIHGNELWRVPLTGTTGSMVKRLNQIYYLTQLNGMLYFVGATDNNGAELWRSGGTASTTALVKDIRPGVEGSSPSNFTVVGAQLFFTANDGSTGIELWKTDGTSPGTTRVKDIMQVTGSSNPKELTASNGWLYFVSNDGASGYELWKSNGTPSGTVLVRDIRTDYKTGSDPKELTDVNGTLFFTALKEKGQRRIYKSNGTGAGTVLVSDAVSAPELLTNVNGTLFFAGTDAAHGHELWKTNGTAAGTVLVKDVTPGAASKTGYGLSHLSYFVAGGNKLYFLAVAEIEGLALWASDGTSNGTYELVSPHQASFTWFDPGLTYFNGHMYFLSDDGSFVQMFRTDGTPGGEELFYDKFDEYYSYNPSFAVVGNYMYGSRMGNIWKTNGTNSFLIRTPYTFTADSNPSALVDVNGTLYFSAYDGISDGLWKTDGIKAGTDLIKHFAAPLGNLTKSGNYLYYVTRHGTQWYNLWRTEISTGHTRVLTNLNTDRTYFEYITGLVDVAGTLYFSIVSDHQPQLWRTSGAPENTVLVKTFNNRDIPIANLTALGTRVLFFTSNDNGATEALWRSDGSAENTVAVKTIKNNPVEARAVSEAMTVNNRAYFIGYDGLDYEVYRTDGTTAGTIKLDIYSFDDEFADEKDVANLMNIDGTLYFCAVGLNTGEGGYGRELWKTNGNISGTTRVSTFPSVVIREANQMFIVGKPSQEVLVMLTNYPSISTNAELWTTNGGSEPQFVKIVSSSGGEPHDMLETDGAVYFHGPHYGMWRSDGTECGTIEIEEEVQLNHLTLSNGFIFFNLFQPSIGIELFIHDPSLVQIPCTSPQVVMADNLQTYPNPFEGEFHLRVNGPQGRTYNVEIKDMRGTPGSTLKELNFNTDYIIGETLSPGLYILEIDTPERISRRIMKTK